MNYTYKLSFLLVFIPSVFIKVSNAQESFKEELNWTSPRAFTQQMYEEGHYLYFEGAINEKSNHFLPIYNKRLKIGKNQVITHIELKTIKDTVLSKSEQNVIQGRDIHFNSQYYCDHNVYKVRKEPYLYLKIKPIKKDPVSSNVKKLIAFEVIIHKEKLPPSQAQSNTYKSSSVLSTGKWHKIAVEKTGIYKMNYQDFADMGIHVNDPRNIRVYGYGGGPLPEICGSFPYDDLTENAIYVHGENDGSFDDGDYILFYGESQVEWNYNETGSVFHHRMNPFADKTHYFINTNLGAGKRIENRSSSTQNETGVIDDFIDHQYHETDEVNIAKTGREWFGESYSGGQDDQEFTFSFPNIIANKNVSVQIKVAASSHSTTHFQYNINGNQYVSSNIPPKSDYVPAREVSDIYSFTTSSSDISVYTSYNFSDAQAWLNSIEVNAFRSLKLNGSQLLFRTTQNIGENEISKFNISNVNSSCRVWDVTDPLNVVNQEYNISGSNLHYKVSTNEIKEFIVFKNTDFLSPEYVTEIENQNLHGLGQYDMVIVTHPGFKSYAEQIADFRRNTNGLSVYITTPQKIYNEFSSGSQDISAIRNFVKMFYDRAENEEALPKYLLLFGDASYDYKDRFTENTNYVPTYVSKESLSVYSYITDDFFGILDDGESYLDGGILQGTVDIGVGRFPVKTTTEAENVVTKILQYKAKENLVDINNNPQNLVSNFSSWRNYVCFVADDPGTNKSNSISNSYVSKSEELAKFIDTNFRSYNIDKIYLDAYKQESTPGGERYPDAKEDLNKRFEKGALIINYIGHGGELGLAHERILEISDIQSWDNKYNLPFFYTQTCEFCRFDDPERNSAGELIFTRPGGGSIGLITTTRPTYASSTANMSKIFYHNVFAQKNGEYFTVGDLYRMAKSEFSGNSALIGLALIGDPAMKLAYPNYKVITTKINGQPVSTFNDTIKALSHVTVSGYVENSQLQQVTDFDGYLYPTIFDKEQAYTTLGQEGTTPIKFQLQKNIIYKGRSKVTNGAFSFEFIVPKDIAYNYDNGKISYYAENGETDAQGFNEDFIIGGTKEDYEEDYEGPLIELYMNDTNFRSGDITDEKPMLLAHVSDEHGINTTGVGIGHDIVAVLDDNISSGYILNDFYQANLDTYKSGKIMYRFSGLEKGKHTLKLKVWDIYNNSSEAEIEFHVRNSKQFQLEEAYAYPNPFNASTTFNFQHNQAGEELKITLDIFSADGRLVKHFEKTTTPYAYRIMPFKWDGTTESGTVIEDGVYFYTFKVKTSTGKTKQVSNKLVKIK